MKKVALITGVTGQDGSYLAQFLLGKGYEVHGSSRTTEVKNQNFVYLDIDGKVIIHTLDLANYDEVKTLLQKIKPDEIYHLAAQSSIPASIENPIPTIRFNISSTHNLLEAIRQLQHPARFFHASSSEIFDAEAKSPLTTESPIKPIHPYGIAKSTCHQLIDLYRNNFNLYAVNGILFPHETPLRDRKTLLQLFISQAKAIKDGTAKKFLMASPENIRDIGDARSYIEAMWLSLQAKMPGNHIICSGDPTSIRTIVDFILSEFQLDSSCIEIDESLVRQPNIAEIFGDPTETAEKLGWSNTLPLNETIRSIIEFQEKNTHVN